MQESIFRDIRIANWEKAFEDGEVVAIPVAQSGPLADCIFFDLRSLDGDGIIINGIMPRCWVPLPTVIIPGKPFSFRVALSKGTTPDDDGQPVPTQTLSFTLHYLTDAQLVRVQEIMSSSIPEAVDQDGRPASPKPHEVN